ncbi:MAG: DUF937 domain-containing protein [Microcoleaceae cyanobacterium MO_207.B10]|nr:DUF937 domain-containing protein [Microcoleaceae cyanobacterium MO_207.B10]
MGLFNQILGAINDPNKEASGSQLMDIISTVKQVSNSMGVDSGTTQTAMSMLGGHVRSALQEKREANGNQAVQEIINQFAGTSPNLQAVQALFSLSQINDIVQNISEKTGFDAAQLQNFLPTLVPIILNLLKAGNDTENSNSASNNILNSFLDTDGDGDVDIADAMGMASRFLK